MSQIKIDSYVVETLMRDLVNHEHQPSAFILYLYLWSLTVAKRRKSILISHQMMAEGTGLSKSAVQVAIKTLSRRRLVRSQRQSLTAVPEYVLHRPWAR